MPTFEVLFISIISILVVSVGLSVVDWIYLSSLSSKAQLLEREVEKKTMEFDALKKERAAIRQSTMSSASVIESSEPMTGESSSPHQSIEDTIQIVRNVRGNFERTEHSTHPISPYPNESAEMPPTSPPQIIQEPPPPVTTDPGYSPGAQTAAAAPYNPGSPPTDVRQSPYGSAPAPAAKSAPRQAEPTRLKLYSDITRDADFQALWQNITELFTRCAQPHIIVDLAGINFMYDKEMDYLEKIKYLLGSRGGSFEFVNCDRELHSLFNNRPQLNSIVH